MLQVLNALSEHVFAYSVDEALSSLEDREIREQLDAVAVDDSDSESEDDEVDRREELDDDEGSVEVSPEQLLE